MLTTGEIKVSYHRSTTPAIRPQWRETHNANVRNGAGVYRRSMSGPIMPMERPGFFARWFK
jgi:hypothetical protein